MILLNGLKNLDIMNKLQYLICNKYIKNNSFDILFNNFIIPMIINKQWYGFAEYFVGFEKFKNKRTLIYKTKKYKTKKIFFVQINNIHINKKLYFYQKKYNFNFMKVENTNLSAIILNI